MSVDRVDEAETVSQRLRDGETLCPRGSLLRATAELTNCKTEFSVSKKNHFFHVITWLVNKYYFPTG